MMTIVDINPNPLIGAAIRFLIDTEVARKASARSAR